MDKLSGSIVEAASRAAAFDNRLCAGGGVKYLVDPLALDYISLPPGGGMLKRGMLPPQEMEVRAALIEAIEAFKWVDRVPMWKKMFRAPEAKEAEALMGSKIEALASATERSREHQAAAARIYRNYPGASRGLLAAAKQLLQERLE